MTEKRNLKGTWNQALFALLLPLVLVAGVRWAVIEPFVIPSGSMIPNLLVHDHLIVTKFSYGLRVPFSSRWLVQWNQPKPGDIVVFRYPENTDVYYIKRLIGLPGDEIKVSRGKITVNGQAWNLAPQDFSSGDSGFDYFQEQIAGGEKAHTVRFYSDAARADREEQTFKVPDNEYFFMGDNRDQSSDGRVWGFVKNEYLIGPAKVIWLSCDQTLPTLSYVCDPAQIRWSRLFKALH